MKKIFKAVIVCITLAITTEMSLATDFYCRWRSGYMYQTKEITFGQSAFEFCAAEKAISESAFHKCVTIDYPESVNALREGNCREIIEKKFKIGESDCTAKFLKPNMEFYSKDCQGPNRDAALIELDKILKSKNINK